MAGLAKRAREGASAHEHVMFAAGAPALMAWYWKSQQEKGKAPPTVMGLDPYFVYGAALYLGGSKLAAGKNGARLEAAGEGMLATAAARAVTRGSLKIEQKTAVKGEYDDYVDDESEAA
jgi:hypothetical protein